MRLECEYCLKMIDLNHYKRHLKEFHKLRPSLVDKGQDVVKQLKDALLTEKETP